MVPEVITVRYFQRMWGRWRMEDVVHSQGSRYVLCCSNLYIRLLCIFRLLAYFARALEMIHDSFDSKKIKHTHLYLPSFHDVVSVNLAFLIPLTSGFGKFSFSTCAPIHFTISRSFHSRDSYLFRQRQRHRAAKKSRRRYRKYHPFFSPTRSTMMKTPRCLTSEASVSRVQLHLPTDPFYFGTST
jgi:hypothetical protein